MCNIISQKEAFLWIGNTYNHHIFSIQNSFEFIKGRIGTSSPTQPLDVNGNVAISGTGRRITGDFSNATVANRVMFQTSTVNSSTSVSAIPNGTNVQSDFFAFNASDPTNASLILMRSGASETTIRSAITGTGSYLPMTFHTGGSERVRIDTSGNVGIGTSSPGDRLTISGGNQRIQKDVPEIRFRSAGDVTRWYIGANISDTINGGLHFGSGDGIASGTPRMIIDSSGNVGIGTNSPTEKLQVHGNVSQRGDNSRLFSYATDGTIICEQGNGSITGNPLTYGITTRGAFPLLLGTNSAERMRIDSAGNVGIGTSSPLANLHSSTTGASNGTVDSRTGLHIQATNITTGTANARIQFSYASNTPKTYIEAGVYGSDYLAFGNGVGSSEAMRIDSSGNLLVGT